MPKKIEQKLKKIARSRGYSKDRTDRYVYGTIKKLFKRRKK